MRIWFNHWFSQSYHFINALKEKGHYIIGTNERNTCVYKENSNEFYLEPVFDNESDYIDWALKFAKEHNIEIFFVRRNMSAVVHNIKKFEALKVKVICETDVEMFDILQGKNSTMDFFRQFDICNVPDMKIVKTLDEFKKAYKELKKKHEYLCIKYNKDEGGQSYKLISPRKPNISRIKENNGLTYTYEYICDCLKTVDSFEEIVVMPYLNGTEISVDCLKTKNGLIAVPRYKLNNRVTKIVLDEKFIDIANKISEKINLEQPYNIQFKYHDDELYLLEINTRLSGGAWKAKYLGCDFVNLCIDKLDGKDIVFIPSAKEVNISNIEEGVILDI